MSYPVLRIFLRSGTVIDFPNAFDCSFDILVSMIKDGTHKQEVIIGRDGHDNLIAASIDWRDVSVSVAIMLNEVTRKSPNG